MQAYIYTVDPEFYTGDVLQEALEYTGDWLESSVSSTRNAFFHASTGVFVAEETICSREAQVAASLAARGDKATSASEMMQNLPRKDDPVANAAAAVVADRTRIEKAKKRVEELDELITPLLLKAEQLAWEVGILHRQAGETGLPMETAILIGYQCQCVHARARAIIIDATAATMQITDFRW